MSNNGFRYLTLCTLVIVLTNAIAMAQFQLPGRGPQPVLLHWSDAEFVFVGKLDEVQAGPVAKSFPPIYNHTLKFTIEKVLRGDPKAGEIFSGHHSARQEQEPIFPEGRVCLVACAKTREGWKVNRIEDADEQKNKDVEMLCKLPLGWNNDDGKILSPWAEQGMKAWPKEAAPRAELVCSKSGRPALLCGAGVKLSVEAVPPKKAFKFKNPDGDGQYQITLTNTTKRRLRFPPC